MDLMLCPNVLQVDCGIIITLKYLRCDTLGGPRMSIRSIALYLRALRVTKAPTFIDMIDQPFSRNETTVSKL
jgi:hypothetical protein